MPRARQTDEQLDASQKGILCLILDPSYPMKRQILLYVGFS